MPLSDIVNVVISTQNPGVTQAGFGVDLIVSHSAAWAERTRTYKNIAAVGVDFAVTTPEYLAASKIFGQSPAPTSIMIGRAANKPTQSYTLGVFSAANATIYSGVITDPLGVAHPFTFTSADAVNDNIITGIKASIDGLGLALTTSTTGGGGAHQIHLVANVAGAFWAIEINDSKLMTNVQDHADPGIVADLTAIALESNVFYGVTTLFNSKLLVAAAASWIETNKKLYVAASVDSEIVQVVDGSATDIAHTVKGLSYFRTAVFYHPAANEFADAATMGRFFPFAPGSENWTHKTLVGVTAKQITGTQQTNAEAKRAAYYYTLGGTSVIGGNGLVAANEYIDVVRFNDWMTARMQERLANLIIQNLKVPYTDQGIGLIEAEVRAQIKEGIAAGGINPGSPPGVPVPSVSVPTSGSVPAGDRASRTLNNVNANYILAGAINHINVNMQVSA